MYCDLNLRSNYSGEQMKDNQLIQLITSCMEDNYQQLAITRHFKDTVLQPMDICQFQPYEQQLLEKKYQQSSRISQFSGKIQLHSRITLEMSDIKYINQIKDSNKILQSYDLIALKPKSERIFLQLANEIDVIIYIFQYFDIITFDCFDKLPFIPKLHIVKLFVQKGILLELNYSDALQDPNKRRNFISNASIIINATKGKNIIFSSDTDHWLYHRSPYDLAALAQTLGMKKDQAIQAVGANCLQALKHSNHRKTYKGTISEATQEDVQYFQQKRAQKLENEKIKKKVKITQQVFNL